MTAVLELVPEKYIVAFVTILITHLHLSINFYIMGPALGGLLSPRSLKILTPLNILLISIYINYYLACTTNPGNIPEGWEPPSSVLEDDRVLPVGFQGPRFCKKCEKYKPPRAHHCKQCGQCILRMDHHCPWIGNCVGFGNYSHFIRFVFSAVGGCIYAGYLLLWRLQRIIDAWNSKWPSTLEVIIVILNIALIGVTLFLVGILAIYHTFCLFKGQTTIEGWERTKTKKMIRRRAIEPVEFPFDIGFYKNICSVLGDNPLLWAWPQSTPGDGIHYTVKSNTGKYNTYIHITIQKKCMIIYIVI
ncbi:DHHC palmitoyltransferase-domain-containing protein [Cokeromyces recurvatus]|uniref:DHHC palmitoyltransferase-domain-containing protein n=1 Tax=Cokeromyces recurvatus TaxID=90255 RepID=UPI00221E5C54|nr:DHHC palmitoyltransferase-domain-containing protein [Cokeromyces recurvatus]KAI7900666.1 DHHC palmitoyltransferase-domain-containing protein [Cokeromyces recurvatus]